MEIIHHCCKTLKENSNVVDRRLGLSDILDRATHALDRCGDDMESSSFPKDLLVVAAVVAARSNRPVIVIEGLNLIFHLIIEGLLTKDIMLDHVPFFSSLSAMVVGKSAVWVIVEALCHVMGSETLESPLQMKAVSCVAAIVSDFRLHLAGTILISTLQSCFNLALTSAAPAVQARARQILRAAIRDRVVKPVLEVAKKNKSSGVSFNHHLQETEQRNQLGKSGRNTKQDDGADNDEESKKASGTQHQQSNRLINSTARIHNEIFSSTPLFMMSSSVKVHRPDQECFDPSEYLKDFTIPKTPLFLEFVEEQQQITPVLRDVVQLLESFFRLASHPISAAVKTPDDVEIKTRQLALDCIISILSDFPDHSIDQENSIISPILILCEDSLWSCIGANIATTAPSSFFVSAVHLLTVIAMQAHYALLPSFRKFCERVVFPLIKSRYSTLEQKVALLSIFRAVFSHPHLVVSYFLNYDCLAPLNHSVGFLQFILHSVVETAFLDYSSDASDPSIGTNVWVVFSSLQQATLRCECLSLVGMFIEAMWRWLEEPVETQQIVLPSSLAASSNNNNNNSAPSPPSMIQQYQQSLLDQSHYPSTNQNQRNSSSNQNNNNNNNNTTTNQNHQPSHSWTPPSTPSTPATFGVIPTVTLNNNAAAITPNSKGGAIVASTQQFQQTPRDNLAGSIVRLDPTQDLFNNNAEQQQNSAVAPSMPTPTTAVSTPGSVSNANRKSSAAAAATTTPSNHHQHRKQQSTVSVHNTSISSANTTNKKRHRPSVSVLSNSQQQQQQCIEEVELFGEPDIPPNVLYHWKHLHHALTNRLIELEAKMIFDKNWKLGRQFLIKNNVISADDSVDGFAKWIRNTPGLKKNSICSIFEKMVRDKNNEAIVSAYIASFDYQGIHVDEALRKILVSLMSDDSIPKFEGQVWEKLIAVFAEKYHDQNKNHQHEAINLSQEDVDAMANAVFFLHSTQHNAAVKDKMTMQSFIRNAADMVQGKKLPEGHWNEIYNRVCRRPWGPENPNQQVSEIDGAEEWKQNYWGQVPKKDAGSNLWAGNMASHSEYFGSLRFAEQLQLRYIQRASECCSSFLSACGGDALRVRKATPQSGYCVPHFAIHIRLMMRMFYPIIAAACILGNKLCFTGPHVTLAQTLNYYVSPLVSLFGISTDEPAVKIAVARVYKELLEQSHTSTTALAGHPGVMMLSATSFV